jgi:hypothetical protein
MAVIDPILDFHSALIFERYSENEGRAGPVGATYHGDRLRRQLDARIEPAKRRIVPRSDLAEEDPGQGRPVQDEIAGLDALDIHHGDNAADDGGKLHQAMHLEVRRVERHVGGAEGHLPVQDQPDAIPGADRAVGDRDAGLFLVGVGPPRVDRKGKSRPCPGNIGRHGGRNRGRRKARAGREHLHEGAGHGARGVRVGKRQPA